MARPRMSTSKIVMSYQTMQDFILMCELLAHHEFYQKCHVAEFTIHRPRPMAVQHFAIILKV
jgi:hypothetical protein